nr:hypothetical protein [Tanacetum cinerariifolium]
VPEIYMHEFWATSTVHHHFIRFKMDNKKHFVNLEYFTEMLHICPRLPGSDPLGVVPQEECRLRLPYVGRLRLSGEIRLNWHYVIDNQMFTTIKLVSRHQNTQQLGAMLPIELTNEDIRNSEAYKEYYAVAIGATPPKTKASVQKTKSSFDTTVTPPTAAAGKRLSTFAKGKQPAKASKAKSLTVLSEVAMIEAEQLKLATKKSLQQTHISQASGDDDDDQEEGSDDEQDSNEEGKEFIHPNLSIHDEEETRDEESFDPIAKTPENTDNEGNDEENLDLNVGREEGQDEEDDKDELYRDVNINLEGRVVQMDDVHTTQEFKDSHVTLTPVNPNGQQQSSSVLSQFVTNMLNPTPDAGIGFIFETTSQMDVQAPTTVALLPLSSPTLSPLTIATISTVTQAPTPPTTAPSTLLQDLPNFGSLFGFDHRLKTLEANFFEFSIQSDRLRDEDQAKNEEFLKNLDENIQKIIKEQVKEQVKVQVFKILPQIEQTVNEQLEAKVLTRSSNSSKTSYAVAADLSEIELKKILIEKIEGNKSIHGSNKQRNLYKALVEAYVSDKIILDTYGDTVTLKRHRDDDVDKDEEPFDGLDRGSKRRREGKEPDESATAEEPMQTTHEMEEPSHQEFETGADDQSIAEPSQHREWFSQQKKPPTPNRDWNKTLPATHGSIQPWIGELAKQTDSRSFFNELMDTPVDFLAFLINRLKVDTLTPELLAVPTYELMKGSCKSLVELKFFLEEVYKATTDQLDWINPKGQQYPHNLLKPLPLIPNSRGRCVIPFDHFINNDLEYLRGDLQLGVESYQKKLNLTRLDTYHSDLKRKESYPAYSNPRGFIYQNKDKQNRLMWIDELHKFIDGTLTDVRTALDDRLKGIRMKYLPQTIWRKSDNERAATMIQAIDKQLKTRRVMRSMKRFVGK